MHYPFSLPEKEFIMNIAQEVTLVSQILEDFIKDSPSPSKMGSFFLAPVKWCRKRGCRPRKSQRSRLEPRPQVCFLEPLPVVRCSGPFFWDGSVPGEEKAMR